MYDYHCGRCGGLVPEPMKAYSYAGRYCHCAEPLPPKQVAVTATTSVTKTHNTREVEEIKNIIADEVLTRDGQVYLSSTGEERLKQTHHQQLQKARQAIADVLCAKLEGVQTYGHEYLISKEEVKKIIKQTLSNK